jgi:hypothetical protein
MSQQDAKAFFDLVRSDPAVFKDLYTGTANVNEFLTKAVAVAANKGLTFEAADLAKVMADLQLAAQGALTDAALDSAAGGGGQSVAVQPTVPMPVPTNPFSSIENALHEQSVGAQLAQHLLQLGLGAQLAGLEQVLGQNLHPTGNAGAAIPPLGTQVLHNP